VNRARRGTYVKAVMSAAFGPVVALLAAAGTAAPAFAQLPFFPPAGCGLTPTNGTESKSMIYSFTDYPRQYSIHVPAGLSGQVPLLVSLPDNGGTPATQETKTGWTPYSDSKKFIVVYPQGNNNVFNPMDQNPDKDFLRALVAEVSKTYCIDATRVYIEGQGVSGAMSEKMACVAADVYASAGFYEDRTNPLLYSCTPSRKIAVGVLQPEDGVMVSVSDGAALRDTWIARNGCSTTGTPDANPYGQEGAVYGGCNAGADVLWRTYTGVNGGGGGVPTSGSYSGNYPTGAAGADFRDKLWSFFMAHPKP